MILVNVLTTMWKREVDPLRRRVCVRTAALPRGLQEDAAEDLEPGSAGPSPPEGCTPRLRRAGVVKLCG